jgi:alginate O-acetyltransferase complex protein AlgJ
MSRKNNNNTSNVQRQRHQLPMLLVWGILVLSLIPFLLAITAPTPEIQGKRTQLLSKIPLVGLLCVSIEKWYAKNIEPVQEMRPLVTFPASWEGRWHDINKNYARFEKWFADHLGLRDLMIRSKNELDYRLFRSSTRVYFGKEDDVYGRSLVDRELPFTESILDTPEKIDTIFRGVVHYAERMKAQGVTTVFITPMQKLYFSRGRLPFFAPRFPESTNFMALYQRMRNDQRLNFVDVFEILKSSQAQFPIFHRQDFHWTDMAALAVAKETVNLISFLENSATRWQHPIAFEYKPMVGSDARFAARLISRNDVLQEPLLIKTWQDVHTVKQLDVKQTGLEFETDTLLDNPDLLPQTCMYGNSFSDGLVRAGLADYFQSFTKLDRNRPLSDVPDLTKGRCKYLIVQILDLSTGTWLSLKQ